MQKLFDQFKREEKEDQEKKEGKNEKKSWSDSMNAETLGIASLMVGGLCYGLYNTNTNKSEEVTYIDFINNYLAKN